MKLAFALTAATLFGTGAYLLLHRDLVRVVLGVVADLAGGGPDADRLGADARRGPDLPADRARRERPAQPGRWR